jgi:hypothetical protein
MSRATNETHYPDGTISLLCPHHFHEEHKRDEEVWCYGRGNKDDAECEMCNPADSQIEKAYRRGVHQAIAAIDSFIHEEENLKLDPASVLDIAKAVAKELRHSGLPHSHLLHDLIKEVKRVLAAL